MPGINKPANLIEITEDAVHLRVPSCSKEPSNSADIDVSADSPLLAEMLRAYRPIALEHNDGFLFIPGSLSARKKRRPRAMIALLRPAGECPHAGQCTQRSRPHSRTAGTGAVCAYDSRSITSISILVYEYILHVLRAALRVC